MASTASVPESSSTTAVKVPLGSMLVVCIVAVLTATATCTSVLLYLAHHRKLGAASVPVQMVADRTQPENQPTRNVVLEPMLVNLADQGGHSYLRLSVVLAEPIDKDLNAKEEKPAVGDDAAVRDAILAVLGSKTTSELLEPNGKELLKQQIKIALQQQVPLIKVQAVYFTDFLVQQ